MELIRKERRLVRIKDYKGICDNCSAPVTYPGELIVVEIHESDLGYVLFPVDLLFCPECNGNIAIIRHFKSYEVSAEFLQVTHENK